MKSNWPWYATRVWHAYPRAGFLLCGFLLCRPFRDAFTSHSRSNNSHLRRNTEFMNGNAVHLRGCGARARVAKVRGRESPRSRWHHRYHGHGLHRDLDQWFAIKMFKNNQKQRRRFSTIFFKFSDLKSYNIIDRLLKYKYEIHLRNIEFITFQDLSFFAPLIRRYFFTWFNDFRYIYIFIIYNCVQFYLLS